MRGREYVNDHGELIGVDAAGKEYLIRVLTARELAELEAAYYPKERGREPMRRGGVMDYPRASGRPPAGTATTSVGARFANRAYPRANEGGQQTTPARKEIQEVVEKPDYVIYKGKINGTTVPPTEFHRVQSWEEVFKLPFNCTNQSTSVFIQLPLLKETLEDREINEIMKKLNVEKEGNKGILVESLRKSIRDALTTSFNNSGTAIIADDFITNYKEILDEGLETPIFVAENMRESIISAIEKSNDIEVGNVYHIYNVTNKEIAKELQDSRIGTGIKIPADSSLQMFLNASNVLRKCLIISDNVIYSINGDHIKIKFIKE